MFENEKLSRKLPEADKFAEIVTRSAAESLLEMQNPELIEKEILSGQHPCKLARSVIRIVAAGLPELQNPESPASEIPNEKNPETNKFAQIVVLTPVVVMLEPEN